MEEQPDKKSKCSQDDGSGGSCDGCNKDEEKSSGNTDQSSHQDVMANEIEGRSLWNQLFRCWSDHGMRERDQVQDQLRDMDSISQRPKALSDTEPRPVGSQGDSVPDKAEEASGGPLDPGRTSPKGEKSAVEEERPGMELRTKGHVDSPLEEQILGGQNTSEGRSWDVDSISQRPKAPSDTEPRKYMGLCNQGSTCYLNSLLQCLFFTPELRRAICSCDNTDPGILHSLKKLFQELTDGKQMTTTTGITMCLGIRNVNQQQDIEEYFRQLMDKIIEEKEGIRQLYEVKQVHTITCCECRLQTKVENPVLSLSLSFQKLTSNHSIYSVTTTLDEMQQESTFTGDDQLYCENCGCKQDATSKYCFESLPQILVLHLKRYQFDSFTGFRKLSCVVSVPLSLDVDKEDHPVHYDLYAMCHHSGGIQGGHYLAEIKPFGNDSWYEFNDSRVREMQKEEISSDGTNCVSTTVYLLMYRRRVDPSAGSTTTQPEAASTEGRGAEEQDYEFEKQQDERSPGGEKKMPSKLEDQRKWKDTTSSNLNWRTSSSQRVRRTWAVMSPIKKISHTILRQMNHLL
ncbi:ubiquitin carboxyl-terminal hydrolase 47-like [Alligator mississippiensis]|uniref:Ubiquitin carboxyl-terminal hydrolase n=1 Tax=Alligator mississippiensis TaxID=8496 RepID=A0A151NTY9_ALLMI|nr:ubiquitin carboxyl-terminal hydrolase 47-like [Alligator mississippiensis]